MSERKVIGIVGHKGSGKTTLAAKLTGLSPGNRDLDGTQETELYEGNDLLILDYPACDDAVEYVRKEFERTFLMPRQYIVLIDGSGGASATTSVIKLMEKVIETGRPFLVCFTFMDKIGDETNLTEWKKLVISRLEQRSTIIRDCANKTFMFHAFEPSPLVNRADLTELDTLENLISHVRSV